MDRTYGEDSNTAFAKIGSRISMLNMACNNFTRLQTGISIIEYERINPGRTLTAKINSKYLF
jgi:hypothetical protein